MPDVYVRDGRCDSGSDFILEFLTFGAYDPGYRTHRLEYQVDDFSDGSRQYSVPEPESGLALGLGFVLLLVLGVFVWMTRRRENVRPRPSMKP